MNNGIKFGSLLLAFTLASCSTSSSLKLKSNLFLLPESLPLPSLPAIVDAKGAAEYRLSGLTRRKKGDLTGAIADFNKAVELDGQNPNGRDLLGWTLHLDGQGEEAKRSLLENLQFHPDRVPTLNALGIVYLVNGDLDRAIATHNRAKELAPDNEIAYYNLSLAYHRLLDYEEAIAHAEKAAELEPYNPHPLVALAIAYWDRGDLDGAIAAYRRAINLDARYRDRIFLEHLKQAGFSKEQIETSKTVLQGK